MEKPTYKCNYDIKCDCEPTVIQCEWYWDPDLQCWICVECGVTQ